MSKRDIEALDQWKKGKTVDTNFMYGGRTSPGEGKSKNLRGIADRMKDKAKGAAGKAKEMGPELVKWLRKNKLKAGGGAAGLAALAAGSYGLKKAFDKDD